MKKIWVTKLILAVMLCGSFGGANAAGSFCTGKRGQIYFSDLFLSYVIFFKGFKQAVSRAL